MTKADVSHLVPHLYFSDRRPKQNDRKTVKWNDTQGRCLKEKRLFANEQCLSLLHVACTRGSLLVLPGSIEQKVNLERREVEGKDENTKTGYAAL